MSDYTINVYAYLVTTFILSVTVPIYILWKYSNRKVFPYHTYLTVFIQYFCAIGMMLMIPLDLALTVTGRRSQEEKDYYDKYFSTIESTYITLYWVGLLCNLIMIFEEQYNFNGFFTVFGKIKNTCKQLSVQAIILCVICAIFFGILIGTKSVTTNYKALFLTSVLLTNTFWMGFLVLLLGYGLVMFPYDVWKRGNFEQRLFHIQYDIAHEFVNVTKAYAEIFLCLANIQKTKEILEKAVPKNEKLLKYVNILVNDSPVDINCPEIGNIIINKQNNNITVGSLADYREILYKNNAIFTTAQGKLNKLQMKAYFLEDLIEATSTVGEIDSQIAGYKYINWSFKQKGSRWEYIWYINIKPIIYKIIGSLCGILSICSYLGIVSMINKIPFNIFPYYIIIHNTNISQIELGACAFISIGYLCYVIKWALFKINIFKSMELIGNKVTWPIPLSTNSRILASLAAPLSFFYLGILHENGMSMGDKDYERDINGNRLKTIFSDFYKMDEIPIIKSPFNIFFSILILCISFFACAQILNKLLVTFHCDQFQLDHYNFSPDALEEGKAKLTKRKKIIKKAYKKMLQHNNRDIHHSFFDTFFKGFFQHSKFHCEILVEEDEDDNEDKNDEDDNDIENNKNVLYSSGSLSLTDPNEINMELVGRRISQLGSVFRMYSTKVAPEDF